MVYTRRVSPVPIAPRIDLIVVIATAAVLIGLGALVSPLLGDPSVPWFVRLPIGLLALGTAAFTLAVSLPVRYAFEEQGLFVRAGALRLRFAYRDLRRAVRVLSPLSGPSWSWVRVRLYLDGGGWIEIAPRDREAFLAELSKRAPRLQADVERGHPRRRR